MDKIKTATGKEFPLAGVPVSGRGRLYIRLKAPVSEVAEIFSDPKETQELKVVIDKAMGVNLPRYALWTKLIAIVPEGAWVRVVLAKE